MDMHRRVSVGVAVAAACLCLLCGTALAAGDVNRAGCDHGLEGFPGLTAEASPGFRSFLPDCRAYELVTPPYIGGQYPTVPGSNRTAGPPLSADGDHLLMVDYGGFNETENVENDGYEYGALYELTRTATGWSTEALDPPASEYPRREFTDLASADLSKTLWALQVPPNKGEELPIEPPQGVRAPNNATLAIREAAGGGKGHFRIVGPVTAPGHTPSVGDVGEPQLGGVLGASDELTHVFLLVPKEGGQSWPGDATVEGGEALYEYQAADPGEPVLVGVKNEAPLLSEAAGEGKAHVNEAADLVSQCGSTLGDSGVTTASNAISASGEVVYFTAAAATEGPGHDACNEAGEGYGPPVNEIYARVAGARTVKISGSGAAAFRGASEDGAKVFFSEGESLYEAELAGGEHPAVTRLTTIAEGASAGTPGVAAISQDGQRVYFESTAVLTKKPNGNGEAAEPGAGNLYVYDTQTARTAFVGDEVTVLDTTRDGQYMLLRSTRQFKGTNDTSTVTQLFEYDAESEAISRVTVGQQSAAGYECEATHEIEEGYNCDGNTATTEPITAVGVTNSERDNPFGATSGMSLAANGTVAFVSSDALTPLAVAGGENVYEYRAGNVYLIAAGDEAIPLKEQTRLLGIDEVGGDVLFASTDVLVPQDIDTQSSWYDAREAGGFPAPSAPPVCVAEGCLGALSAPPSLPGLGGSAVTPPGGNAPNAAPPAPVTAKPKTAAQIRAEKLAKALKGCRAKHNKSKPTSCEKSARKRYGAKSAKKAGNGGRGE